MKQNKWYDNVITAAVLFMIFTYIITWAVVKIGQMIIGG